MSSLPRQVFLPVVIALTGGIGLVSPGAGDLGTLRALSFLALVFGLLWLLLGRLLVALPKIRSRFAKVREELAREVKRK